MENGDETLLKAKDDAKLILRIAKDRDRDAFRELYERYAGRIKGAMIRSGARNDEADETAQEAMLAIWRKADTFDPARAHRLSLDIHNRTQPADRHASENQPANA